MVLKFIFQAANPVAQGKTRAKQDTGKGVKQALCIMVHGDAAMTAQGVVSETLALSNLPEYTVGMSMYFQSMHLGFK